MSDDEIVMNGLTFQELDEETAESYQDVVGRTITHARIMTQVERDSWGWGGGCWPMVFELDDGSYLIPSEDEDGNGPGDLFHVVEVFQDHE